MWGFAHGILEVPNPHFQESFHISKAMSALTQTAVYGAYFLMALPAGWIIRKWGYRRGVITGLVLFGIGALMFIPGSRINSFYFFILSQFVIGCGLTCLETSANPYTTVLGHPDQGGEQNQPVAVAQWYRMDCRTAGWRSASVLGCQHCHSLCPGGYLRAFCGTGAAGLCHPHLCCHIDCSGM